MYANGAFENTKQLEEAVNSIGRSYGESIAALYEVYDSSKSVALNEEFEIDPDDPFFRKGKFS